MVNVNKFSQFKFRKIQQKNKYVLQQLDGRYIVDTYGFIYKLGGTVMGKLNATAEAQIREICDRYKGEKTPLMMILSDIQNEYG